MSINDLRKQYPGKDFLFFRDGREMRRAPFLHDKIKSYEVVGDSVFIEM